MRSDAKLGLVCAFVLVAGVAAYFGLSGRGKKVDEFTPAQSSDAKKDDKIIPSGPLTLLPPTPASGAGSVPGLSNPNGVSNSGSSGLLGPRAAFGDQPIDPPATAPGNASPAGFGTLTVATPPATAPGLGALTPGLPSDPGTGNSVATGGGLHGSDGTPTIPPLVRPGGVPPLLIDSPPMGPGDSVTFGKPTATGPAGNTTYVIKSGDSFAKIAKATYGNARVSTINAIMAANPGVDPKRLKVNQKINLPAAGVMPAAPAATKPATTKPAPGGKPTTGPATTQKHVAAGTYTVKKGDDLGKIAMTVYGSKKKWRTIYNANKDVISDPDVVRVGTVLKIPAA